MKPISQEKLHTELAPSAFRRLLPGGIVKDEAWAGVCAQGYNSAPWYGRGAEGKHAGGAMARESMRSAIGRMFLEEGV